MSEDLVRVKNTHSARVAGVDPGKSGEVARWIADGPLGAVLEPVDAAPVPPPLPPEVKPEKDENSHEARAKIRAATTFEEIAEYLTDSRKSVAEAAAKKARQIEGLEPDGD
jgi:hypothetical protein